MKIVIPGGTGQVGEILRRRFTHEGHDVVIVSRQHGTVQWDGRTIGPWADTLDGADVVINLAGRTVNCRYTEENLRQMMDSRVDSTRVVGHAIAPAKQPPAVWLQMSTATVYAHRYDAPNDEATGIIGGSELGVPAYWKRSVDIGLAWEKTLNDAQTPKTRKVALRTSMVMSPDRDGIYDVLATLTRRGLGGSVGGGRQFVSWIHESDLCRAIELLLAREDLEGAVNLASPSPIPQRAFMKILRDSLGVKVGLPAAKWMAEIGAWAMRTDTELLLKSRRVVPKRLLDAGFSFEFSEWVDAAKELATRWRAHRSM